MTLAYFVYGFYFLVILAGAFVAAFSASLVRALVGLILTLCGVAGMYLLMNAPFLAFMQLLIYAGAVCVLIFFAIMLARAHAGGDEALPAPAKTVRAVATVLMTLVVLLPALILNPADAALSPPEVPLAELGARLLRDFALPFELISAVLLVAMAGAVFLIRERRKP